MRYSTLLALAGTALALPAADPRPAPTAAANPIAAPVAAPEPTAMADPQLGLGVTTPFGSFNIGSNPNAAPPPPANWNGGRPLTTTCNGFAAYCIYSSVSGSIYSSVSGGIQDGILDALGLKPSPTPAPYNPNGYRPNQPPYQNQPYQNQPYQNQPYQNQPYQNQPYQNNGGWPSQPQPGPGQYQGQGQGWRGKE